MTANKKKCFHRRHPELLQHSIQVSVTVLLILRSEDLEYRCRVSLLISSYRTPKHRLAERSTAAPSLQSNLRFDMQLRAEKWRSRGGLYWIGSSVETASRGGSPERREAAPREGTLLLAKHTIAERSDHVACKAHIILTNRQWSTTANAKPTRHMRPKVGFCGCHGTPAD